MRGRLLAQAVAAAVLAATVATGRGDELTGCDVPSADAPYPAAVGESVDPWGHAFWPVRVRRLDHVEWRSAQGGEIGAAVPARDGLLRVLGGGGGLRAIDPASGEVRWVLDGNARYFNYSSAAVGAGDVAWFGNFDYLSAATPAGKLLWRTELGASWMHSPPALSPDGATVYVGGDALGIAALDAATGAVRWLRRDFHGPGNAYAFDRDGRLLASQRGRVTCFEPDGAERWTLKARLRELMVAGDLLIGSSGDTLRAYDLASRGERWIARLGADVRGIALGDDGRVRAALADGAFASVELSGDVGWRVRLSEKPLGPPVTSAGGEAVVVDADGVVRVVDVDGETVSCLETGAPPLRWRPTVLKDGRVVVNDRDDLLCLGGAERPAPPRLRATKIYVVADDFVVNVWHNGKPVPLPRRHLLEEIHGAMTEVIDVDVRDGDWLVFHVVANRLRWGGSSYFGACAMDTLRRPAFWSAGRGNWSACDDPSGAASFIADRGTGADRPATAPATPWGDAPAVWRKVLGGEFPGEPVWGTEPSTWIKCVVPPAR
jgi:outer membrane protein assembly factor BamB